MNEPRTSPWRLLLTSRKGAIFFLLIALIGLAAVGFVFIILREAWAGRVPIKDAMTQVFGTVVTAVGAATASAIKLMGTIEGEDVARINAGAPKPPIAQQTTGPIVNAPAATSVHAEELHATPAETPHAKHGSET